MGALHTFYEQGSLLMSSSIMEGKLVNKIIMGGKLVILAKMGGKLVNCRY
jgi:hypothetical protein